MQVLLSVLLFILNKKMCILWCNISSVSTKENYAIKRSDFTLGVRQSG